MSSHLKAKMMSFWSRSIGALLVPAVVLVAGCEQSSTTKEIEHVNQSAAQQKQQIDLSLQAQKDRATSQKEQIDLNAQAKKAEIQRDADDKHESAQNQANTESRRANELQKSADQQREQAAREQDRANDVRR
ncbi:MAG TPA: hypothetical protein VFE46_09540 [Pirellulales bacterium]|jgi:hypothetical protein|nr:hypothetical protein [Pirellulales bacterium]